MNGNFTKSVVAVALGALSAYFKILAIPLFMLICVMLVDYVTGLIKAGIKSEISSKVGALGAIKKLCYFIAVIAAAVVDWLVTSGLHSVGVELEVTFCFGLIVTIWFIINELISILENLTIIGVPLPALLVKITNKLKVAVEKKGEEITDD